MKTTDYYNSRVAGFAQESSKLKQKLVRLSGLRLLAFLAGAAAVYFLWSYWQWAVVAGLACFALFLWLVSKYSDVKDEKRLTDALKSLNEKELEIAAGNFFSEPDGKQFINPKHEYSVDIDLFGRGSFYQYLNRTVLKEGAWELAKILTGNNLTNITGKREVIKELSEKPEFRQYFTAAGSLIHTETSNDFIINWLSGYKRFTVVNLLYASFGVTALSVVIGALALMGQISSNYVGYVLALGLFITGRFLKKINTLSENTDKVRETFRQYAHLVSAIEKETFTSEILKEQQKLMISKTEKTSDLFKEFSKRLDALDSRNNIIGAVFGNGFLLMDIRNSYFIERWIAKHQHRVADWFRVIAWFDAYNSLGNYAFNHPGYVYPVITDTPNCIRAVGLGHPLLKTGKRVDNDINIENRQFFIITGANMAGKSTFLRTVSLHIVMANAGLPVCAKYSEYTPVKLITSMRTSDSLTDDSSYFFSELTRLKYIVDAIEKEPYFIILDEILKGTNSTDKAMGSRKFVEKLVKASATGIIATHDLSLCEIENELLQVKNYYFDAEIVNDELYFDYTFKKGICRNMNASFLLRKMEII